MQAVAVSRTCKQDQEHITYHIKELPRSYKGFGRPQVLLGSSLFISHMAVSKQSIEEQVENHCKEQLRSIKTYTKTESINPEIDEALRTAPSKKGGKSKNYPDIKCFIETQSLRRIPSGNY